MLTSLSARQVVHKCHVCDPRGGCLGTQLLASEDARAKLCRAKKIARKGEHLFREGEIADCFYVLRSGSMKSYLVTEEGEDQVLGFYLPGDVLGLDTGQAGQRLSSAVALETTSICRIPHMLLADCGEAAALLKITAEQSQHDHNLVLMLARKDADGRIASFIEDLACRYWLRGYSASAFVLSMSRQDIGCYLGLAVETVSRTLTRFQESGVLRVNRREVEILDHARLRKIAGTRIGSPNPDACSNRESALA